MSTMSRLTISAILETKKSWKNILKFVNCSFRHSNPNHPNAYTYNIAYKFAQKNYKFTQKEQQILSECYDSAFYIRGVPLGIGLTIMVEIGVRNGYIKVYSIRYSINVVVLLMEISLLAATYAWSIVNSFDRWNVRNLPWHIQCNKHVL